MVHWLEHWTLNTRISGFESLVIQHLVSLIKVLYSNYTVDWHKTVTPCMRETSDEH